LEKSFRDVSNPFEDSLKKSTLKEKILLKQSAPTEKMNIASGKHVIFTIETIFFMR
jgi:hypothetical protein